MPYSTGDNTFGFKWIVNPVLGKGTHLTLVSALASAVAGDTIQISPGTYTENGTLKNGVNLAGLNINGGSGGATKIIGKFIDGGGNVNCTLTNLSLQTNADFCMQLTGSGTVVLSNVRADGTNNTILSLSGTANLRGITSSFALLTTGIAVYTNTGSGGFYFQNCEVLNSGLSTTASSGSGPCSMIGCNFQTPIVTSGTGTFSFVNGVNDTSAINTVAFTTAGTGITSIISNSAIKSGSASGVSVGANTQVAAYESVIDSTNINPVTGAGTYKSDATTYSNTGILPNTTTRTFAVVGENSAWTPVLAFGGASVGITYSTQTGSYTRIGNVVTFTLSIVLTSKGSSTGAATITGLPYAAAASTIYPLSASTLTYVGALNARHGATSATLNLDVFPTTGARTQLADTAFANTTIIQISGSYLV